MKNNLFFLIALIFIVLYHLPSHANNPHHDYHPETCENHPHYSFEAEFSALILKPGSSNMHYAAEAIPLPVPSPNWNIFDIHPHYLFGFDLGFKVMCHRNNTSFMINWEHFKSCSSACVSVATENMIGPFFEIGPDATPYSNATGRVTFDFNEVNIDVGYSLECGDRLQANIFAGIGITNIKQMLDSMYSNTDGTIARTICTPHSFIGAGPQLGVYFSYNFINKFYLNGRGICSLLTGTLKNHTQYLALSPALKLLGITPPNNQRTCVQNRTDVVPAFEEKLGLAYKFNVRECYFIQLEVGYMSQIYINALQSVDMGSEVITPPVTPDTVGVFARTFQRNTSNFSLAGPYVTFDVGF
jgi:hypothetical protein